METDLRTLLSDAQFVIAQILWEPRCDRTRAVRIAALAAKTHPDPHKRAMIGDWLSRAIPPIPPLPVTPAAAEEIEIEIEDLTEVRPAGSAAEARRGSIEALAIDHLQRSLRAVTDAAETRRVARVSPMELAIPTGLGYNPPTSPYLELSIIYAQPQPPLVPPREDDTQPCPHIDFMWPDHADMTRPYDRV